MNCEQYRRYLERAGLESRERSTWSVLQADEHSTWSVFREHERQCASCAALAQQRRRFDVRIHHLMHAVPVPPGGVAAVAVRLRPGVRRRIRKGFVQALALAASLMIAVGAGYALRDSRIVPTPDMMVVDRDMRLAFEHWSEVNAFDPVGPRFNGRLFTSEGPVEIRPGVSVPSMTLTNPDAHATANVYVINTADIPEDEILDLAPATALLRHKILRDARNPDIRYFVLYTGSNYNAFLLFDDI